MVRIVPVGPREAWRASGMVLDMPVISNAALDEDGTLIALYGLAWGAGRCWAWFHVENYRPGHGFVIRREARRLFRKAMQLGETEVFTPRDAQFATSEKLLRMLGFKPFAVENGQEVYRWQV